LPTTRWTISRGYADLIEAFGSQAADQLRQSGIAHYQTTGFGEGREADFHVDHYLANYDDLRAAFADGSGGYDELAATLHYIQAGYFEGRTDDLMMA
jgi:serralysin